MFRAKWTTILAAGLTCCGAVLAQKSADCPRIVTIQEPGKPAMQCRVLKTWSEGNTTAFEVESLSTRERITLVEETHPTARHPVNGKVVQEVRSRIYHWTHNMPPAGAPMAPPDALVPGTTAVRPAVAGATSPSVPVQPVVNPTPSPALATVTPAVRTTPAPAPAVASPAPMPAVASTPTTPATATPVPLPGTAFPPASDVAKTGNGKVEPAPASDWHQSWGKAEDHKTPAAAPVAEQPPSHMPAKVQLPQAAKDPNDPLANPEPFSPYELKKKDDKMEVVDVKPEDKEVKKDPTEVADGDAKKNDAETRTDDPAKAEAKKDDVKKDDVNKDDAAKKAEKPVEKKDSVSLPKKPEPKKAETGMRLTERFRTFLGRKDGDRKAKPAPAPMPEDEGSDGMRSVYAACEAAGMPAPGKVPPASLPSAMPTSVDTDPSNAFTTVVHSPEKPAKSKVPAEYANAFTTDGPAPQTMASGQPGGPPPAPYGYAGAPRPGMAPPYGYANGAAPQPGMPRYGAPNGVVPAAYGNMNPAPMGRPIGMDRPGAARVSSTPETQQLLLVLRSSLFPSNREWAADQLSGVDANSNPVVVEMLLQSAKNDPAPSVREACVRNLGKMNARSPSVIEALTELQKDENNGVRSEVGRTLSKLQTGGPAIQPASLK